jgi:hypothetical protein
VPVRRQPKQHYLPVELAAKLEPACVDEVIGLYRCDPNVSFLVKIEEVLATLRLSTLHARPFALAKVEDPRHRQIVRVDVVVQLFLGIHELNGDAADVGAPRKSFEIKGEASLVLLPAGNTVPT